MAPKFPFPARNQTSVVQIVVIHLTDWATSTCEFT
jgi:hypothetical protein